MWSSGWAASTPRWRRRCRPRSRGTARRSRRTWTSCSGSSRRRIRARCRSGRRRGAWHEHARAGRARGVARRGARTGRRCAGASERTPSARATTAGSPAQVAVTTTPARGTASSVEPPRVGRAAGFRVDGSAGPVARRARRRRGRPPAPPESPRCARRRGPGSAGGSSGAPGTRHGDRIARTPSGRWRGRTPASVRGPRAGSRGSGRPWVGGAACNFSCSAREARTSAPRRRAAARGEEQREHRNRHEAQSGSESEQSTHPHVTRRAGPHPAVEFAR